MGPHPAGLPGTHIHWLHHVRGGRVVWHVGYQDVIAMGRLFAENVLDFGRVVAIAGDTCRRPRLLQTRLGASLEELTHGEGDQRRPFRVLSGSPLSIRPMIDERPFLARFDVQVSMIEAPTRPRAFAWWWRGRTTRSARDTRGSPTGMLPLERFERMMQPGFLAVPLLRALMTGDINRARELGCLELIEEDLALCAWACPARSDYSGALRSALARIEKEG
jgi:Na+-transporting NADH:ubiquinone oxidoreductase subunit A